MLWIQNVSPDAHRRPDDQPHDYVVRINNQPPLARFQHVRAKGAAACLRAAAGRRLSRPDGRGPETSLHFLQESHPLTIAASPFTLAPHSLSADRSRPHSVSTSP